MSAASITLQEIVSQPRTWRACLEFLRSQPDFNRIRERAASGREWLFIGCGTSFYLAQVAAASFTAITGVRARPLPASEIILYPKLALAAAADYVPVLISRSGRTSEVLRAGKYLADEAGAETVAITCDGNELQKLASSTLRLPLHEQSTVMTGSFTSMLLALQYLAAAIVEDHTALAALDELPARGQNLISEYSRAISDFVASRAFADYVFLGQGPFFGVASEGALKVTESSCSYAQVFHTMEFRHGPKSIVSPETLITFMLSEEGYAEELDVLQEVKSLGGAVLAVTSRADSQLSAAADLVVEVPNGGPEWVDASLYVVAAQLLGVYTAMRKGLDPDQPRNLSRVVLLKS